MKSINWTEGQFIQPHHFQQAFLELQEQMESVIADYIPHAHGVAKLNYSESDCENGSFLINEIDVRFPSGARVSFPGNADIAARSFAEQLDANKGRVEVFLGLPLPSEEEPNCEPIKDEDRIAGHKYRYKSVFTKVNDFADGGNPREIEVKRYNPRILFTGESDYGYETVRIAAVVRSGQYGAVPKPDKAFVPPCINITASPMLMEVMREIGNRLIAKNRAMRAYWKSKDTASMMKARDGFKVQALATSANAFAQLASVQRLHPFTLYTRIAEVTGQLSLYCTDDRVVAPPTYDHENLGRCFAAAQDNLVKLLAMLEEATFESRVFEIKGDMLVCPMEPAWFDDRYEIYICFEGEGSEGDIAGRVATLKIAGENVIPILNKRRIRGMAIEGPTHHLTHLPTSPKHHYYKVPRDTTYFPKLQEYPTLAIWGDHAFADLVTLYLVERNS